MTIYYGVNFAQDIATYHEAVALKEMPTMYQIWQSTQDLYNNEVGRQIGLQCSTISCAEEKIKQAIKDGQMLIIQHDANNPDDTTKWAWTWSDGAPVYWVNGKPSRTKPEDDKDKQRGSTK
jgi:hypothetical protein